MIKKLFYLVKNKKTTDFQNFLILLEKLNKKNRKNDKKLFIKN